MLFYNTYVKFCEDNNVTPSKNNIFSKMLKKIFPQIRSRRLGPRGKGVPHYGGISARNGSSPPVSSSTASTTSSSTSPSSAPSSVAQRRRRRKPNPRSPTPSSSENEDSDDGYLEDDDDDDAAYEEGSTSSSSPPRTPYSASPSPSSSSSTSPSSTLYSRVPCLSPSPPLAPSSHTLHDGTFVDTSALNPSSFSAASFSPFDAFSTSPEDAFPMQQVQDMNNSSANDAHPEVVMRLVERFEKTFLEPTSSYAGLDNQNDASDQNESAQFAELWYLTKPTCPLHLLIPLCSGLCDRAGVGDKIKATMEVILSMRSGVHASRAQFGVKSSSSTSMSLDNNNHHQQQLNNNAGDTIDNNSNNNNNKPLPASTMNWLPGKQALETAFSVLRNETGPGPKLLRLWVLSLLAEVQMLMGKESTAFRTAQLYIKTLEDSIAHPPHSGPPFSRGSMDFFEGIAHVFNATGNDIYLTRLVSLLLHARQFDNDLAQCVDLFASKWHSQLYS